MKLDYKGYKIEITQDSMIESPRDWDNLGTFVMFHKRYDFGDKHKFSTPDELQEYVQSNEVFYLPVYMLDHSGLSISTTSFSDPWDSGQIGIIFIEKSKVLAEFNKKKITPKLKVKALEILEQEIKTLNQYVSGDVYSYLIEKEKHCKECSHANNEHVDSLSGLYGYEYAISEAKAYIDSLDSRE